jgi:hypothetical protein
MRTHVGTPGRASINRQAIPATERRCARLDRDLWPVLVALVATVIAGVLATATVFWLTPR